MIKDLFFNSIAEAPNSKTWVAIGKPYMWIKEYCKTFKNKIITIWSDIAYGKIRIAINDRIAIGDNLVLLDNFIIFGIYYTGSLPIYQPIRRK